MSSWADVVKSVKQDTPPLEKAAAVSGGEEKRMKVQVVYQNHLHTFTRIEMPFSIYREAFRFLQQYVAMSTSTEVTLVLPATSIFDGDSQGTYHMVGPSNTFIGKFFWSKDQQLRVTTRDTDCTYVIKPFDIEIKTIHFIKKGSTVAPLGYWF